MPPVAFSSPNGISAIDAVARLPPSGRRLRRFGNPYNLRDGLACVKNWLFGPARGDSNSIRFLPNPFVLADIQQGLTIVFLGDVMPTRGRKVRFGEALLRFVEGADCLVANLEGVISADNYVWNSLLHDRSIVELLETLVPARRTILGVANNHAADCGSRAFSDHCRFPAQCGFEVIGSRDRPSIAINDRVQITNCSFWSNLPCDYVATPESIFRESAWHADLKILFPHWGFEMQLHPARRQIQLASRLLESWHAIVGHHSHCPQPIVAQDGRLLAYSLGNFVFGASNARWHRGLILKVHVGPDPAGRWKVGQVEWSFICGTPTGDNLFRVDTVPDCHWFPDAAQIPVEGKRHD